MHTAYKRYWQNYINFGGISSRADYWWVFLINFSLTLLVTFLGILFAEDLNRIQETNPILMMLIFMFFLALFFFGITVPTLSLTIRRLRDAEFHWLFIFLPLIPFGSIALIVLLAQPSKYGKQVEVDEEEESELFL